jgi:hypothetical protein
VTTSSQLRKKIADMITKNRCIFFIGLKI